ncbi:glycosyltransferase [Miltoncostaea marina]|uniref:glycosyltransferase n=1 Tax=Miltoncostaea marina TaxID=2843215 RepID=UPI001C3CF741|nr:glycosyltransferase [Miltoncostaea marina]
MSAHGGRGAPPRSGALTAAQAAAGAVVLARLARGRRRRPPLAAPPAGRARPSISVVVPARDEAARIGPCLAGLRADPALLEVVVVDDCSSDGTAGVAAAAGARVVAGTPPPPGWVGKPWALQQGLEAASGEVVVVLDADTLPRPGLAAALADALDDADLVTAGAAFVCEGAAEQALHAAMLATLVYRFGPGDAERPPRPARMLVNGQCMAARRERLLAEGGFAAAAGHLTDDAALGRALAARGWRVAFVSAGDLLAVRMYRSARETWTGWGRSIALADVTSPAWRAADVAVTALTMALPVARALAGRPRPLDLALLAVRAALLAGLRGAYARPGPGFWLSPLADPLAVTRLTRSALRPDRRWRGRAFAGAAGSRRTGGR